MEVLKIRSFHLPFHRCKGCGKVIMGYICPDCRFILNHGHGVRVNEKRVGKGRHSFSIEFETGDVIDEMADLIRLGFIATNDDSIGGWEWKSPIYQDFRTFAAHAKVLDKFSDMVDDDCGTHLHVGTFDIMDSSYIDDIENAFVEVMTPLLRYLYNSDYTVAIWGRFFNAYAGDHFDSHHYNWVNIRTSTHETIEWRLPRWRSFRQYYPLAKWIVNITPRIVKWMLDGWNYQDYKRAANWVLQSYKYFEVKQLRHLGYRTERVLVGV